MMSEAAEVPAVDGLTGVFSGFFGTFSDENPTLTAGLFVVLCLAVVAICYVPFLISRNTNITKRNENILKYETDYKKHLIDAKIKARELKVQQEG
ncbi:hypothetical protein AB4169_09605 [Vibrio lentus]